MTTKSVRISLFKSLRKAGIPKAKISENASLQEDLFWDDLDLTLFMYHLETIFKRDFKVDEIKGLYTIKDTINYLSLRTS